MRISLNDEVMVKTLQGGKWIWVNGRIESIKKDGVMVLKKDGGRRFVARDWICFSIREKEKEVENVIPN